MRRGWWACAEALAEASVAAAASAPNSASNSATSSRFAELQNLVALEARSITARISGLRSSLESARPPSQVISPAFQWAQSPDKVFLNVKFSHKIDAPATLDVVIESVELTPTRLKLRASKERKLFVLDLPLRGAIDPDASTWSLASVGRAVFTLKKAVNKQTHSKEDQRQQTDDDVAEAVKSSEEEPELPAAAVAVKWASLLVKGTPKPNQMHLWWDRQSEFQKDLDALPDEDDGDEEEGGSSSLKKEKKKKKKRKSDDDDEEEEEVEAEAKKKKKKAKNEKKKAKKNKSGSGKDGESSRSSYSRDSTSSTEAAAASSALSGGGGGFVAEAVAAIEAEKKAALAEVTKTFKEKKAAIESEASARKKELAKETAAEKARIEADFEAEIARAKGEEEAEGDGELKKKRKEEKGEEDDAELKSRVAELYARAVEAGQVLSSESPGVWQGKEASHTPTLTLTNPATPLATTAHEDEQQQEEEEEVVVVSVSVAHPSMTPEHFIEYVWVAVKGKEATPQGVLAVATFDPTKNESVAEVAEGKVLVPALTVSVPRSSLGDRTLVALAACNLHGVWEGLPTSTQLLGTTGGPLNPTSEEL